jgi:hypothetical protein
MKIYYTDSQIPELGALEAARRKLVLRNARKALAREKPWVNRLPIVLASFGAIGAWLLTSYIYSLHAEAHQPSHAFFSMNELFLPQVGAVLGGFTGGMIGQQILFRKLRSYLQQ